MLANCNPELLTFLRNFHKQTESLTSFDHFISGFILHSWSWAALRRRYAYNWQNTGMTPSQQQKKKSCVTYIS